MLEAIAIIAVCIVGGMLFASRKKNRKVPDRVDAPPKKDEIDPNDLR
jgi:hypothetical protein